MQPLNKSILFLVGFLGIILISPDSTAQEVWNLENCIQYAQNQNISVKRIDLLAQGQENAYKTAKAALMPSINGFATHNLSSGKTVNFEDYTYINTEYQDGNLGVQGQIPIFSGMEVSNTIKQQKWAFQAAIMESEKLRNSIALQVTSAFLQVIFSEELLKVAEQQLEVSLKQVENTSVFVEQGPMALSNLREMKAQAATDEFTVIQSKNQVINAKMDLAQLMNLETNTLEIKYTIESIIDAAVLPRPQDIYQMAIEILPQIKSAEYLVRSSDHGLASARGRLSPSVGISGIFYSRYSELGVDPLNPASPYSYTDQLADNSYGRLSLNINIPIYNQRQNLHSINQAKIQSLDAKYALDEARNSLRQEIYRAYTEAQNAFAKYEAADKALSSIEKSHEYISAKYESGLSTSLDYNISKSQMLRTQSNKLQAKYEFVLRSKILDFYRGIPIEI